MLAWLVVSLGYLTGLIEVRPCGHKREKYLSGFKMHYQILRFNLTCHGKNPFEKNFYEAFIKQPYY